MTPELAWMVVAIVFIAAAAGVLITWMVLSHRQKLKQLAHSEEIVRLKRSLEDLQSQVSRLQGSRRSGPFLSEPDEKIGWEAADSGPVPPDSPKVGL